MQNDIPIKEFRSMPELYEKLCSVSAKKIFKPGEILIQENKYVKSIPIILKGVMKVIRTEEDGREILLYYIKSGESCVMSMLNGIHHDTTKIRGEVEEDTEVLFLPVEKFNIFIKEYPQWLEYIFSSYHKRFEEMLKIVDSIAFKKVDERLLELLHKKVEISNSKVLTTTHEQLANELGTARVVVSRLLKQLEYHKILKIERNKLTMLK